jgi:heme/copper-type cytochrome/quinol oxidase subunit 1
MTIVPMMWLGYSGMPRRVLDYPASMGGWHSITSAGHLVIVGGMIAFFIMLFDSLRQGRAATRNTFGISRFNTRLNFYLYVGARTLFLQRKGWFFSRFNTHTSIQLSNQNYTNYEYLETTLFSYSFVKN